MELSECYDFSLNARVVLDWSNARLLGSLGSRRFAHRVSVAKINTFARLTNRSYAIPTWDEVGFIGIVARTHALFSVGDVVFQNPWAGKRTATVMRRPRASFVGYSTKKRATIACIGMSYMRYDTSVVDNKSFSMRIIEELINDGLIDIEDGAAVRVVLRPLDRSRELATRPLADADVRSYAIEALQAAQAALR